MIISNPPYIGHDEKSEMTSNTLLYEPSIALFPEGDDILIFYKKILKFANAGHLKENGTILCEINEFTGKILKEWLGNEPHNYSIIKDFQGKDRILKIIL
ncbi:MAG: hypothetical protein R2771_06145 [Saprospiraceae bacterium]